MRPTREWNEAEAETLVPAILDRAGGRSAQGVAYRPGCTGRGQPGGSRARIISTGGVSRAIGPGTPRAARSPDWAPDECAEAPRLSAKGGNRAYPAGIVNADLLHGQ